MKTARERFAYNLKNIRKNKEMNQEDLALKCDVSKTTVTNWEIEKLYRLENAILCLKAMGIHEHIHEMLKDVPDYFLFSFNTNAICKNALWAVQPG